MKVNKLNIFERTINLNHKLEFYNELKNKYNNLEININKYDVMLVKSPFFCLNIKTKYNVVLINFERFGDLSEFIKSNLILLNQINNKDNLVSQILNRTLGVKIYYSIWSDSVNMLYENRFDLTHFINSELHFRNFLTMLKNRYYRIKRIN